MTIGPIVYSTLNQAYPNLGSGFEPGPGGSPPPPPGGGGGDEPEPVGHPGMPVGRTFSASFTSCPDPNVPPLYGNNLCSVVLVPGDPTVPGSQDQFVCVCEIDLRKKEAGKLVASSWQFYGATNSGSGGVSTAYFGRPGDGYFFHIYHDIQGMRLPYFDVYTVDGSVTRYRDVGAHWQLNYWVIERTTDPYDNVTSYVYDTQQRLSRVRYPSGIDQVWDYSPTWIGSDPGDWSAQDYSGVEVRYEDASATPVDLSWKTEYLLYRRLKSNGQPVPGSRPFAGDLLYRVYSPKCGVLDDLAGAAPDELFAIPSNQQAPARHRVTQLTYHDGTSRVKKFEMLGAESIVFGSPETQAIPVRELSYVEAPLGSGLFRVQRVTDLLTQYYVDHQYATDLAEPSRVDYVTTIDSLGTTVVQGYDDRHRLVSRALYPNANTGMPRASDPDSQGVVEPASVSYQYVYSACSSCSSKPSRVTEQPSQRQWEFDYDALTGLLTEERVPSPSGSGVATTSYHWEPAVPGKIYAAYKLTSLTAPNGATTSWQHTSVARVDLAHGVKHATVTSTSPPVTLFGGQPGPAVLATTEFNVAAPIMQGLRQLDQVGQVVRVTDGDGVVTEYTYDTFGWPRTVVANPSGGDARVESRYTHDRVGRLISVEENLQAAQVQVATLAYDGGDQLVKVVSGSGAAATEQWLLYDRWGNLAVQRTRNANSAGGAPDDFGTPARTESARAWLHDEWHYLGKFLVRTYLDRRELDRNDSSGPIADAGDARFLRTDYLWTPDGLIDSIAWPSGALTSFVHDGYGTLYRRQTSSPGSASVVSRWYIDASLDVVRQIEGEGAGKLVTSIVRNSAGMPQSLSEPVVAAPSWYPWAQTAVTHEVDWTVLGAVRERRVRSVASGAVLHRQRLEYDELGRAYLGYLFADPSSSTPTASFGVLFSGATKRVRVTDPTGRYLERMFDGLGRVVQQSDSLAAGPNRVEFGYQAHSTLLERITQSAWDEHPGTSGYVDRITDYRYDSLGRQTEILQGPPGSQLRHQFTYYSTGDTETYTDPTGKQHKYLPDALGRLAEHFMPGVQPIWNGTTYADYVDGLGRTEVLRWDGRSRLTKTIFDHAGRAQAIMDPGASTEPTIGSPHQAFARFFEYDTASRITKVFQGDGILVTYYRDGAGRLLARSSPTPALNGPVSWFHGRDLHRFDGVGRVVETAHLYGPDGAAGVYAQEVSEYDGLGRRTRESFKYLWGGNWVDVESSYTGADALRTGLTYDNNLTGDADDLWLTYTPDSIGRLANLKWRTNAAGTPEMLGEYLHEGAQIRRRTTHWDVGAGQSFTTDYRYDAWGRMDKIEQSFSATAAVEFVYDDLTAQGSPYKASASNLVKEIYQKQGAATHKGDRFAYDEHHRMAKAWLGSDQTHLNATDPDAGVGAWVSKLTYGLDAANNRTSVTQQNGGGGAPSTETYSTQDAGEAGGASNRYDQAGAVAPTYDQRGNTTFDGSFYYVYDDQNRLTEVYVMVSGGDSSAMMSAGSTSASSEQRLATRASGARRFRMVNASAVADARNRILTRLPGGPAELLSRSRFPAVAATLREPLGPMAVRLAEAPALSSQSTASSTEGGGDGTTYMVLVSVYLYDSGNRRVTRIVSGVQNWFYAWDGWSEAQELVLGLDGSSLVVRPQRQFAWGEQFDELVAYRYQAPGGSWAEHFVAEGGAHCPSRVLNEQGQVVEVQEYDPYGATTFFVGGVPALASAVGNPFGWKAVRIDPETGLLYMRNRYYAPKWGRFLTQDPLGVWGDPVACGSGYSYGRCRPTSETDPSGMQVALEGSNVVGVFPAIGGVEMFMGSGESVIMLSDRMWIDLALGYSERTADGLRVVAVLGAAVETITGPYSGKDRLAGAFGASRKTSYWSRLMRKLPEALQGNRKRWLGGSRLLPGLGRLLNGITRTLGGISIYACAPATRWEQELVAVDADLAAVAAFGHGQWTREEAKKVAQAIIEKAEIASRRLEELRLLMSLADSLGGTLAGLLEGGRR